MDARQVAARLRVLAADRPNDIFHALQLLAAELEEQAGREVNAGHLPARPSSAYVPPVFVRAAAARLGALLGRR